MDAGRQGMDAKIAQVTATQNPVVVRFPDWRRLYLSA